MIADKIILKKHVKVKQEQMLEVLQSNDKYEQAINKMKMLFVENPLYDFMSKKEKNKKKK